MSRDALEAVIDDDPERPDGYLVLADYLQQQGDPRGELIVRWKDATKRDRTVLETSFASTLGPAKPPRHGHVTWSHGFIRTYRSIVDSDEPDAFVAYIDHPSMRFVQFLDLAVPSGYDGAQWIVDAIASRPRPSWRHLTINSYQRGGVEPPLGELDLDALWSAVPRLKQLHVLARHVEPGSLASASLESLEIDGEIEPAALAPLLAGSMPRLQELVLHDVPVRASRDFGEQLAASPLARQLAKRVVGLAAPDRYDQVGE